MGCPFGSSARRRRNRPAPPARCRRARSHAPGRTSRTAPTGPRCAGIRACSHGFRPRRRRRPGPPTGRSPTRSRWRNPTCRAPSRPARACARPRPHRPGNPPDGAACLPAGAGRRGTARICRTFAARPPRAASAAAPEGTCPAAWRRRDASAGPGTRRCGHRPPMRAQWTISSFLPRFACLCRLATLAWGRQWRKPPHRTPSVLILAQYPMT